MESYSAIKEQGTTDKCIKCIDLENLILCERRQTQKSTCCMIPFMWSLKQVKLIYSDKNHDSGCLGRGWKSVGGEGRMSGQGHEGGF